MPGINPQVIFHRLNVLPEVKPVKQKKKKFAPQVVEAVREVVYPDWVSNVVIMKKVNDKWKMCIDFTNLNKACPKDNFSLPLIDCSVDASAGHRFMSFMDAFSSYNQILLGYGDQKRTAFITEEGLFYY
ncbi:RNA-directed DNA polymerase-like protein [Gossypium australe]|uniref:RNA-directed DNA polymerase-like protein n=1 Tax=Gossypium australe TaxID=47621 RepID=A0A5B6UTN6_9ROSI|nr:RNA-directed DNA polymerase-like protein [Gossypium australe]